ncbi:MAG: hypothetical protein IJ151_01620 [Bacteroidales bacterium]|nr:hypothetical protein [Bacteroidales bacterium]
MEQINNQPGMEMSMTPEASADLDIRNEVARILVEDKAYLNAVRYYMYMKNCTEGESRKYVDDLNSILRSWAPQDLMFKCPQCYAPLHIGQKQCHNCGRIVCTNAPTEKKVIKTTWWSRNKNWLLALIILQTIYIIIRIIVIISESPVHYY